MREKKMNQKICIICKKVYMSLSQLKHTQTHIRKECERIELVVCVCEFVIYTNNIRYKGANEQKSTPEYLDYDKEKKKCI